jgi:hypothetical protein
MMGPAPLVVTDTEGGTTSGAGSFGTLTGCAGVVATTAADCVDSLFAASNADALKVYVVAGVRPVLENDAAAVVATGAPFLKMRYPVTPTLSVDAIQLRSICVAETTVAARFAGTLGAVIVQTSSTFLSGPGLTAPIHYSPHRTPRP